MIVPLLGGIGLFLLGMVLMTEGLRTVAGDALRRILSRFVSGPITAIASGAVSTMLVQSSSATALTTIGFVSAGMITFPQAIGVIMGANLGTTSIGWIVAVLGFQMDISMITLPLIAAGALMRLVLRRPWAQVGLMLAGFGLIFLGIGTLQEAMDGIAGHIDLARFADPTLIGRLVLLLIGVLMVIVMQASGAALAATLAALHSEAINLDQAAVLVIGQNVGTTVKVGLAAIGGRAAVKRTAAAHLLFNVTAAIVAFALLDPFVWLVGAAAWYLEPQPGVLTLAAFHTAFNLLGVLLFLPWLNAFATAVVRLVPERDTAATRHLDRAVVSEPEVAVEAARQTVMEVGALVANAVSERLQGRRRDTAIDHDLDEADHALFEVRQYLRQLAPYSAERGRVSRPHGVHLATLHAVDHLDTLIDLLRRDKEAQQARGDAELDDLNRALVQKAQQLRAWLLAEMSADAAPQVEAFSQWMAEQRRARRPRILERTASGELTPDLALKRIDALQWIDSLGYHLWRTAHHLSRARSLGIRRTTGGT